MGGIFDEPIRHILSRSLIFASRSVVTRVIRCMPVEGMTETHAVGGSPRTPAAGGVRGSTEVGDVLSALAHLVHAYLDVTCRALAQAAPSYGEGLGAVCGSAHAPIHSVPPPAPADLTPPSRGGRPVAADTPRRLLAGVAGQGVSTGAGHKEVEAHNRAHRGPSALRSEPP